MNLLTEIDSELSAYGHHRPLSKETALDLSGACRNALKTIAAAVIENQLLSRCPACYGYPITKGFQGRCAVCHGLELIPEGLTVPQLKLMVLREEEAKKELADLRHACLAAIGYIDGHSVLDKEGIIETLADAVRDFATGRKSGA